MEAGQFTVVDIASAAAAHDAPTKTNASPPTTHRFIFICRRDHYEKYALKNLLGLIAPQCRIVTLEQPTEGAACTALMAGQYFNTSDELLIANSDQYIDYGIDAFLKDAEEAGATVRRATLDPMAELVMAQRLAVALDDRLEAAVDHPLPVERHLAGLAGLELESARREVARARREDPGRRPVPLAGRAVALLGDDQLGEAEHDETEGGPDQDESEGGIGQPPEPMCLFAKSEFFRRSLPSRTIRDLLERFSHGRVPGESREVDFMPWGGAYNRVHPDATAFVHREERFQLKHAVTVAADASGSEREAAQRQVDRWWRTVHPWGSGRVFQNFPDPDLDRWSDAYYGPNVDRLVRVQRGQRSGLWRPGCKHAPCDSHRFCDICDGVDRAFVEEVRQALDYCGH